MQDAPRRIVDGLHLTDWSITTEGAFLNAALDDYGQALHLAEQLTQTLGLHCSVHPLGGPDHQTYSVRCDSPQNPLLVNPLLQHVSPDPGADAVMEQEIEAFVRQGVADGTYDSAEHARAALFSTMRELLVQSTNPDPVLTNETNKGER